MGSRNFGKKEIDALSSRIRLAQGLGNNGVSMVTKTRSDIESAIGEAITPEWARVLRGIPVDELNAGKAGIRTNVLKEAGYGDVYSVYAASQQNLAAVNGIGEVMSLRAKENAAKIASDVNSNVKLKISVDHKTEEYSRLVTAVAEHMRARENLPKCEQLLSMIPGDTEEQLKKLSCAKSGLKWMFTGGKKKDEAQTAYDSLSATASAIDATGLVSQIQGYQGATAGADVSAALSAEPSSLSSIIGPISIAAAWNDFARRPISSST